MKQEEYVNKIVDVLKDIKKTVKTVEKNGKYLSYLQQLLLDLVESNAKIQLAII